MDDDVLKDDELEGNDLDGEPADDELGIPKKKGLLDDENVESLDDAAEEELDVEEPFDDTYDS